VAAANDHAKNANARVCSPVEDLYEISATPFAVVGGTPIKALAQARLA
jgi:hypothetical protein